MSIYKRNCLAITMTWVIESKTVVSFEIIDYAPSFPFYMSLISAVNILDIYYNFTVISKLMVVHGGLYGDAILLHKSDWILAQVMSCSLISLRGQLIIIAMNQCRSWGPIQTPMLPVVFKPSIATINNGCELVLSYNESLIGKNITAIRINCSPT